MADLDSQSKTTEGEIMDRKTQAIVSETIAKFDAAVSAGDLREMNKIVSDVCASPNIPFRHEVLRQLDAA